MAAVAVGSQAPTSALCTLPESPRDSRLDMVQKAGHKKNRFGFQI